MTRMTASQARDTFAATLSRVAKQKKRIVLHRRGRDVAALVPLEDLALLEEMEDRLDAEAFRAAKGEWEREGRQTTSLDEVVKELGLKA